MVKEPVFEPSARLTFYTVEANRKRLLKYLQTTESGHLRLDLSQVSQCDSAGLALLIEAKRLCKRFNKSFGIKGMPEAIHDLAKFCGVDTIL
jgi:phospholipid transport system transporter-binding protein